MHACLADIPDLSVLQAVSRQTTGLALRCMGPEWERLHAWAGLGKITRDRGNRLGLRHIGVVQGGAGCARIQAGNSNGYKAIGEHDMGVVDRHAGFEQAISPERRAGCDEAMSPEATALASIMLHGASMSMRNMAYADRLEGAYGMQQT